MSNSLFNDREYKQRKTTLESSPKTIFIQAAGPCNSNCAFCSRGPEYEFFNLTAHRDRFQRSLYPYIAKAQTLALTGSGEFLLLPEAGDILDFFDSLFPEVEKFFATNGSSLTPGICEKIAASKSSYTIHISLHAANPILHKTITRTEHFDRILEQTAYLFRLKKDNPKLRVNLIFVATTLNIDDLPNFIRLASDLHADKVVCYYNYIYTPAQKYLSCFFKQELTNKMFAQAQELADKLNIALDLPPRFKQKEYPRPGICREPFSQIMLDSEGHILPCDASEDCHERLSDGRDFMDAWNSEYYQNLRRSLINGTASCFRHCLRANPACVNNFNAHVIHRGSGNEEIDVLWGDNF